MLIKFNLMISPAIKRMLFRAKKKTGVPMTGIITNGIVSECKKISRLKKPENYHEHEGIDQL